MTNRKLTPEEKAKARSLKISRDLNAQLRAAKGETVTIGSGIRESNLAMGAYVRQATGRTNGKAGKGELLRLKRQAAAAGYIIDDDGEILHDIREEK